MFTFQTGQLDRLLRDTSPEVAVQALKQMLGNCQQPLEHRGPVNISIHPDDSRAAILNLLAEEVTPAYAGFGVSNFTGVVEGEFPHLAVNHGWAALFRGPVNIRANFFDFRRIALVVHNGIWAWDHYGEHYYDHNGDPYWAHAGRWAVAQTDSSTGTLDTVSCRLCLDAEGNGPFGSNITVILPKRDGVSHKVSTGDVLAITRTTDNLYVAVSDYSFQPADPDTPYPTTYLLEDTPIGTRPALNFHPGPGISIAMQDDSDDDEVDVTISAGVRYCVAQNQWEKNSGNPRVVVKALTGWAGSETGEVFHVYLRAGYGSGGRSRDPNVRIGQKFTYTLDHEGVPISTDAACWDDPIGTVKELEVAWNASGLDAQVGGKYISGWALQNGVINATSDGGSGKDWSTNNGTPPSGQSEWPPIYQAPFDGTNQPPGNQLLPAGASLAHNHAIIPAPAYTGVGVAVADHPDHIHDIGCATTTTPVPGGGSEYIGIINLVNQVTPQGVFYTGTPKDPSTSFPYSAMTLSHSVSVSDPGHYHADTIVPTYQPVWYKRVLKIERVDNSFEVLGAL
jgi:hypothetical protein